MFRLNTWLIMQYCVQVYMKFWWLDGACAVFFTLLRGLDAKWFERGM